MPSPRNDFGKYAYTVPSWVALAAVDTGTREGQLKTAALDCMSRIGGAMGGTATPRDMERLN